MQESRNVAARAGRWSARHRKTAVFGWILFVVVAFMIGGKVGTENLTQDQSGVGESGKASKISAAAYPDKHDESVLIQSKTLREDSPEFHAVVADVIERLDATKGVGEIHGPYDKSSASPISGDGHSALVSFEIPGDPLEDPVIAAVDESVVQTEAAQKPTPTSTSNSSGRAVPKRPSWLSSRRTCRRPRSAPCRSP